VWGVDHEEIWPHLNGRIPGIDPNIEENVTIPAEYRVILDQPSITVHTLII